MMQNRSAYVKSPWQFEIRDNPVDQPSPDQVLIKIAACGVCGTDLHVADRMAPDWQLFGHEMSGTVIAVGANVTQFNAGDRVALNTASPCGKCAACLPEPYGRGRPSLCRSSVTYWNGPQMGFGEYINVPPECAVHIPDAMPLDVAALAEPMCVSIDLVETAEIVPGDNVLVIGPGPLGIGAAYCAKKAGAAYVMMAGYSRASARLKAALSLGVDAIIQTDKTPLSQYDFGCRVPDKILVTTPPQTILDAINVAGFGAVIAYIGVGWSPDSVITFDADDFHFRKLSLKASFASPDTQLAKSVRLLHTAPELAQSLISHRFPLHGIADAFLKAKDDHGRSVVKMVMCNE